jgi:hypothetical protein
MVLPEPLPPTDAVAAPPPLVLADPLLLPMEPHPAMVSTTAVSSVALEITVVVRDICFLPSGGCCGLADFAEDEARGFAVQRVHLRLWAGA